MRKAITVVAHMISAECPCGGAVIDMDTGSYSLTSDSSRLQCDACGSDTGSYSLTSDSSRLQCDACGSAIRLGYTARLFS